MISTRFRGGFRSYAKRFIEKLPIKVPESEFEINLMKECEKAVDRILVLKEACIRLLYQIAERGGA